MRPSCHEVVCQRVIAEEFSSNNLIRLLSVLEAPVMYAMSNSDCAIFQRGSWPTRRVRANQTARSSRSPNRSVRFWPADFPSSWFWILTSGAQAPFLLSCCLPGSRLATSAAIRTRGVVALSLAPFFFGSSCRVAQTGVFSPRLPIAAQPPLRGAVGGKVLPSR